MSYKRIEIYVWWTCNQKCTYCMEYENMERQWYKKVTKHEVLKYLIKYKKQNYNHITLLWGEPFIQAVFWDSLKLSKKMWFTTLVTTNASTLHLKNEAIKYLPLIDELILSIQWISKELQQKISRTNIYIKWDDVFLNIDKYWKWSYLKANIVITNDNLSELFNIVKYSHFKWINDIAITYPDLNLNFYWRKHVKKYISPTYKDSIIEVVEIYKYCLQNDINLKIVDFPFCTFPEENLEQLIKITDDIDFWNRIKVGTDLLSNDESVTKELDRNKVLPRHRRHIDKCEECLYKNICWWPAVNYKTLFWYSEINTMK